MKAAMASSDSKTASQVGQRATQGNAAAERCSNNAAAARRGSGRGSSVTGNDVIQQCRDRLIVGALAMQQPVGQLRIWLLEQAQECHTPAGVGHRPATIEPAAQQQVQLSHATAAAPPEETLRDVLHACFSRHG